jgi:predicted phage baseplate assembly protein
MPLPAPHLDDRKAQEIVDEAKRLIPRYCPEWTDHNVSDPGIALVELFAWMTEMLLFRVNQVPEKVYIKLLEMIGIKLAPPQSARAPITFYLAGPQATEVMIPRDTEVATVRTETSPAIVFTTETDLTIHPGDIKAVFSRYVQRNTELAPHDMRVFNQPRGGIDLFSAEPQPNDMFYIALEHNLSNHILALVVQCDEASGAGIDPRNPPWVWEVRQSGSQRWAPCDIEYDSTGGFNYEQGEIVLYLPPMAPYTIQNVAACWLRCRLTDAQARRRLPSGEDAPRYKRSPRITALHGESRGGTVFARHAVTIRDEIIGQSDGSPGQEFRLLNAPLLPRSADDAVYVYLPNSNTAQRWTEVRDFAESGPDAQHYTLDSLDGTLCFGPALVQPDRSIHSFGAVPPAGASLRFKRYQYGGGMGGNVQRGTISVLKTSIPYVARVANRERAVGGRDAETLDQARLRAPQFLRTRTRAMTADDYEYLTCEVAGVSRAVCLGPGAQPGNPADPRPGQVVVYALPEVDAHERSIEPAALKLSAELRGAVTNHLDARRPLGIALEVREPQYLWVSVAVTLRRAARGTIGPDEVMRLAEQELYRYLNPFTGGPDGGGWPFGRELYISEIFALMQRIPSVEFVEEVSMHQVEPGSTRSQRVERILDVPPNGLVCSSNHTIKVT